VINKVDSLGIDMDGASQLPVDEDDTGDEVEEEREKDEKEREEDKIEEEVDDNIQNDDYPSGN